MGRNDGEMDIRKAEDCDVTSATGTCLENTARDIGLMPIKGAWLAHSLYHISK